MEPEALQGQAQADAALATEADVIDLKAILQRCSETSADSLGAESNRGQRVFTRLVVHKDPEISLIPDFIDDDEVEHLLKLTEDKWAPSVVGSGVYKTNDESKDLSNKSSQNRTSYSCSLRSGQSPIVKAIEERLSFVAGMDVDYLERLNMVRYAPGQFFNKHHDGRFRPKTIFLYLNDLPDGDGGETFFPNLGVKFTPRKGCAIMWSNTQRPDVEDFRMVHQGLPPKTIVKYGVNCFFNAKPVRQWEEPDSEEEPEKAQQYRTVDAVELLGNSDEVGSARLRAYQVCENPAVVVIPRLLRTHEAEAFCAYTRQQGAYQDAVSIADIVVGLEARLSAVVGIPESHLADLHTVQLEEGMLSRPQVMADSKRPELHPVKAAFVFLNEVPSRGELRLPHLGLQVTPRAGCAVVWDIATPDGLPDLRSAHLGRPPKNGIRSAATCVFHSVPVR
jgi:prolyl 4-hydroxylase